MGAIVDLQTLEDDFGVFLNNRIAGAVVADADSSTALSLESLWRSGRVNARDLADAVAEYHKLPRSSFEEIFGQRAVFDNLSQRYLREAHIYPFDKGDGITIALADPTRLDVIRSVQLALGVRPAFGILSFEEIELLFERLSEKAQSDFAIPISENPTDDNLSETAQSLQDLARGAPVVRMVDDILERAVGAGATDIHLETERDQLRVRFRVDGYLRRDQRLPLNVAPAVISRIKILAGLDIADRRLPQDGRANVRIGSAEADLRVAVMPTLYGETAVIRILLRDSRLLEFGRIGMSMRDQKTFEKLLAEPHGIVVVTGPTGSGKTTTLATAISMLNDPSRKIVTVEDPIEYQIAGIHQTQIKPSIGLTFATALRSFLRHDPDVIMVGEMRDRETASIGIQAALTGHLVLTTLHTNSAVDAVVRLVDMGVESYLLGASLRGVLGQRLVRKLCDRCKAPCETASQNARQLAKLRCMAIEDNAVFHTAVGCDACGQTGYRGRIGIFEVMRTSEPLLALIRENPNPQAISEMAQRGGMTLMIEDGLTKCGLGLTSVEEILRATG